METHDYTISIHLDLPPDEAEAQVRSALGEQGFGILSTIDVQATLREKVGEDIGAYTILGACNPPLARRAIDADPDIGALLPCNVVVRAGEDGGSDVLAADPATMLDLSQASELADIADDARQRLLAALDHLDD